MRPAAWAAAGLILAGACHLAFREPFQVEVYRTDVPLPGLPPALEGLKVCHLSDLHCGPWVAPGQLRRGVEAARALEADLVVVTGDFVSVSARYARRCGEILRCLRAPLGVFGVLGNHDYWTRRVGVVREALEEAGVRILVNQSVRLAHAGTNFWLCGLDDAIAGRPDLEAATRGVPAEAFRIVLCHEPDLADLVAASGAALQLSGHSHGGQVIVPVLRRPLYLPPMGRRYPAGLHRVKSSGMRVYTNVGLGLISPPFRLNCPPEVGLLTLRSGPTD